MTMKMQSLWGCATSLVSIVLLAGVAPLQARAENVISRPAGFVQLGLEPEAGTLLAMPLIPFADGLNDLFAGQLDAEEGPVSFVLRKWDPVSANYQEAFMVNSSGNPEVDGIWFMNPEEPEPADLTLTLGEGFYLQVQDSIPQTITLSGTVNVNEQADLALYPGLNLLGLPYPVEQALVDTLLAASGSEGDILTEEGEPRRQHWLSNGTWIQDLDEQTASDLILSLGSGYWYESKAEELVTWNETRPFDSIFPNNNEPPYITGITIKDGAAAIQVLAGAETTVDLFAKDLPFNADQSWQLIARNIRTDSDGRVTLTDPDAGPARFYVAACSLTDSDGDGTTDAMRLLGYDNSGEEPTTKGGGSSNTLYVNAATGSNLNDGFTPETAKASINAAIGISMTGDTIYVATGTYNEGRVEVPAGVRMVGQGRVEIR